MKSRRTAIAGFAGLIALAGALVALAQQTNQPKTNADNTTPNAPATTATTDTNTTAGETDVANRKVAGKVGISKLDEKTTGATVRASQLMGANLKNSNDESVGEIKDLVLDAKSGKIRYVAVTYGGFLGLGSKLFAVPFEAFRVRQNTSATTPGDYALTLDVTKDQLSGAQGFETDHWPDFANQRFTQELDRRYKVNRSQTLR
jgi:sporulation protein YlmC with PRC-barrel domain